MNIVIISSNSNSLINFRGELIKDLLNLNHTVFTISPNLNKSIKEKLNNIGVICYESNLKNNSLNIFSDISTLFQYIKILYKIKPDIVFSYTIKPIIYGSIAAKIVNVKNVYSMITGLGITLNNNSKLEKYILYLLNISFKLNKKVIFQNTDDLFFFTSNKTIALKKSIVVNGSGVDLDYFKKNVFNNSDNQISFLFIGRLIIEKGIIEFLQASKLIHSLFPKVNFKVVGLLDQKYTHAKIINKQLDLNADYVSYHGELDDVRSVYTSNSIVVLPSFYGEGVPRVLIEALSMCCPIITTDLPGCKETISEDINKKNGFLVSPKNYIELSNAMKEFIEHPDLIKQYGINSRLLAESKFDVKIINKQIIKSFNLSK